MEQPLSQRAGGAQQRGPLQPKSVGKACFKCGQNGHWSKDCTVRDAAALATRRWRARLILSRARLCITPRSPLSISRCRRSSGFPRSPASRSSSPRRLRRPAGTPTPTPPSPPPRPASPPASASSSRRVPTGHPASPALPPPQPPSPEARLPSAPQIDALAGPDGLAHCYGQLAPAFEAGFRGDGHEARDLARLLDLFRAWQRRLIPGMARGRSRRPQCRTTRGPLARAQAARAAGWRSVSPGASAEPELPLPAPAQPFGEFVESLERLGSTRLLQARGLASPPARRAEAVPASVRPVPAL